MVSLWSLPKAGQIFLGLNPVGAEAEFWLSASNIGRGRGGGVRGAPPMVVSRSNTSLAVSPGIGPTQLNVKLTLNTSHGLDSTPPQYSTNYLQTSMTRSTRERRSLMLFNTLGQWHPHLHLLFPVVNQTTCRPPRVALKCRKANWDSGLCKGRPCFVGGYETDGLNAFMGTGIIPKGLAGPIDCIGFHIVL